MPAVMQLLSFVMDYGMDLDTAMHQPRLDASEGAIVIGDVRMDKAVRDSLRSSFDYEDARIQTFPGKYAYPSAVLRDGATNHGATDTFQPWSDAVPEG
jgi:gamma-glutamyltranspeptidase/glutathione hydrolase